MLTVHIGIVRRVAFSFFLKLVFGWVRYGVLQGQVRASEMLINTRVGRCTPNPHRSMRLPVDASHLLLSNALIGEVPYFFSNAL